MAYLKKKFFISFVIVVLIIIIASFLRLYNLTPENNLPPGLYPDEAMNGNNALEALTTKNFKVFYPENNGREGLFINIQAIFLAIFGNKPWALRLPSAIFGILTVLGLYFLTKELFSEFLPDPRKKVQKNEILAFLAAFFLATSFWHINFSRIGFRAIMAPFFLVWALYFLLKVIHQIKEQEKTIFYILNSIFFGIFYGLGFYSYIAYRATPLLIFIILLLYWLKNKEKLSRKKILLVTYYFLLITFVVVAPLGLYFLKTPQDFLGRTSQISVFSSPTPLFDLLLNIAKTAAMFNFIGDGNWRHNYAGRPLLFWPVGILFAIGFLSIIITLIKNLKIKNKNNSVPQTDTKIFHITFSILLSWLIITALPVVISNEGLPHALRSILIAPPVFILAAVGGFYVYEFINGFLKNKTWRLIIYFLFLSLLIFEAYTTYFELWGKNQNTKDAFNSNYVEISKILNSLPKELPKYVVVEAPGFLVRGIPMPAQTVMFITDTFTPEKQKNKNIYYVLPDQVQNLPANSYKIILN